MCAATTGYAAFIQIDIVMGKLWFGERLMWQDSHNLILAKHELSALLSMQ